MKLILAQFYNLQVRKLKQWEVYGPVWYGPWLPLRPHLSLSCSNLAVQGTLQAGSPPQGLCTVWPLCAAHSPPWYSQVCLYLPHYLTVSSSVTFPEGSLPSPSVALDHVDHITVLFLYRLCIICLFTRMYHPETRGCPQLVQYLAITGVQNVVIERMTGILIILILKKQCRPQLLLLAHKFIEQRKLTGMRQAVVAPFWKGRKSSEWVWWLTATQQVSGRAQVSWLLPDCVSHGPTVAEAEEMLTDLGSFPQAHRKLTCSSLHCT